MTNSPKLVKLKVVNWIINENGDFKIKKLPYQAQYSTVQSIVADDFTGDGTIDLLVAGNRFNVEIETTRSDASVGLFLEGQKGFSFNPHLPRSSGVFLPGDVKELKPISIGRKGGKGILVGVNNGSIRLLKTY